jgi:hypothetical protein
MKVAIQKFKHYAGLIMCSARLKSVLFEAATVALLTVMVSAAILVTFGNPCAGIFELAAGVCIWASVGLMAFKMINHPHEKNEHTHTGLESAEQVISRNIRYMHEAVMCISSIILVLAIVGIGWLIHFGFIIIEGFENIIRHYR